MTHDELLAKLKEYETASRGKGFTLIFLTINALRAVVELHKSKKTTYKKMLGKWASDSSVLSCEYCGGYYPCQTILVIEKELK